MDFVKKIVDVLMSLLYHYPNIFYFFFVLFKNTQELTCDSAAELWGT